MSAVITAQPLHDALRSSQTNEDEPTDCKMKVSGVVNFVTGSLRPIRSDTDERLSAWYKENSRVYVSKDHSCWTDPKLQGKVRKKRFGMVLHSPAATLNGMMKEHAKEVQDWIAARSFELPRLGTGGDSTEDEVNKLA